MNKKELFQKAHELTRKIKKTYKNVNYRFQFSLCLKMFWLRLKNKLQKSTPEFVPEIIARRLLEISNSITVYTEFNWRKKY